MDGRQGLDRRGFLRAAVTSSVALGVGGALGAPALAQEQQERPGFRRVPPERIGVQLYSLRSILATDLEGTLAAVAEIGYAEVELAGLYGRSAAEWRVLLDGLGLRAVSGHTGLDVIRGDFPAAINDALIVGQRYIICPWVPPEVRTIEGYEALARDFNAAGALARSAGLQFGYHNHDFDFDFVVEEERRLYDVLAQGTDRSLVDLQLDLYWAVVGEQDPVELFTRYPRRFSTVHVKDRAEDGSFADVGEGTIDFERIFARRALGGIQHYIVEHDQPEDPLDNIADSYANLRRLRF